MCNFYLSILIFIVMSCWNSFSYAEDAEQGLLGGNLKIVIGGEFVRSRPKMHYQENGPTATSKVVDIEESFADDRYLPSAMFKISYKINDKSSLGISYFKDDTNTSALQHKTVKFLFFPIRLGIRTPLTIETESLKLFYSRSIWQNESWDLGANLGAQVINIAVQADIPASEVQSESFAAALPAAGIYAKYQQTPKLEYRIKLDYLPLDFKTVSGQLSELEMLAEYQYDKRWLLGAGYRIASMQIDLNRNRYKAEVEQVTYGPTFYMGFKF